MPQVSNGSNWSMIMILGMVSFSMWAFIMDCCSFVRYFNSIHNFSYYTFF